MGFDVRSVLIHATSVLGISLALMEIFALALGVAQINSLYQFKVASVLEELTTFMTMRIENAAGFFAALFAFGVSGAVAGVRVKDSLGGAASAFLGSAGGMLIIVGSQAFTEGTIPNLDVNFYVGLLVIVVACSIAGYIAGRASVPPPTEEIKKKDRRIWTDAYDEVWKCDQCGADVPRGSFTCPSCGAGVIE